MRWELSYTLNLRFSERRWHGEPIDETLLIGAEQEVGDIIQFIRFAPLASARCGKLVVQAHDSIAPLIRRIEGVDAVIARNTVPSDFQAFVPVMSLPGVLRVAQERFAETVPHLSTTAGERDTARVSLSPLGPLFKIGFVWSGNPSHIDDLNRSLPFDALLELLAMPMVALVSLQKGPQAEGPKPAMCRALFRTWVNIWRALRRRQPSSSSSTLS